MPLVDSRPVARRNWMVYLASVAIIIVAGVASYYLSIYAWAISASSGIAILLLSLYRQRIDRIPTSQQTLLESAHTTDRKQDTSEVESRGTWSWEELTEEDRKFMKKCSKCGAWSPLASEVCKSCDSKAFVASEGPDRVSAPAQLPVKFCRYCARELSSEARYCDACGRPQAF